MRIGNQINDFLSKFREEELWHNLVGRQPCHTLSLMDTPSTVRQGEQGLTEPGRIYESG